MSGTPAITAFPLRGFPRIDIAPPDQSPWTDTHEAAWRRACAANPRLHDGLIWSATSLSLNADRITVQLDRYKRLAVQSDAAIGELGVRHIGVKGLMTAPDERGPQRILLARRGKHTRAYPNLWEIAPAGGVEAVAGQPLSPGSIIATLIQEAREELGIDASPSAAAARPFLLVRDEVARSLVFMVSLPWPDLFDPAWRLPDTWEYSDSRWLTHDETRQWLQTSPNQITPPARAALEAFLK